ncbi:Phage integrase family protein [Lysobacter sp. yr284]|uniref:tyrosine-type recombinase/integrase n=1 Tax=Lysobacter sp. yr284 TaxID=1761791 RepID=UPI00089CEB64|nr:Phage integrase family protein [Lysobacter sp. yr284]
MKTRAPHIVPLAAQPLALFRELHELTGRRRYVFPGARNPKRAMLESAVNAAMRRLGINTETMTGHGFRATARTILDEVLHFRVDIIEHQLAHAVKDPNGRAYNRTAHLPQRIEMMQRWADYLDELRRDIPRL